jgi:hypothetical protein
MDYDVTFISEVLMIDKCMYKVHIGAKLLSGAGPF